MAPLSYWLWFHLALALLLAAEYGLHLIVPQPRRKALYACLLWVVASLVLAALLIKPFHLEGATQYLAGYVLEQSLSIDNLFVFLLLFRLFRIPDLRQPKVLFWGVAGAMLMRGAFVAAGISLLDRFHWIEYAFAAILIVAAVQMLLPSSGDRTKTPRWITWITRLRPISETTDHFFVRENGDANGRRMATMLFLALLAVELTDIVFALDSIPAVLSITRSPFLAYTSNIMAVMNLRSLYILLTAALAKLRFLHYGMSLILLFAALKMLLADWLSITPGLSLAIIAAILAITILISLLAPKPTPDTSK
ncbi:TerC/Alx family metal homeostasis membrane protein [Granulicella sp. 5B5]|uniref:TerC/Alx family metal homeostasis membrane protein n=1 Tax=Granulicella sp. 5B5 TaxID=1617967 RepID=UPI0015F6C993|nr:TerC/Alx family metal homeostasis membrane protein [Granulicella sp. 5B5]QMV17997.1 TerC/Alx family metal homeostasis membrane protein [Granulicella sp. 5B5]